MKGQEHYREAERLISNVKREVEWATANTIDQVIEGSTLTAATAQVHATLALAAATAYPAIVDYLGDEARASRDWVEATS